MKTLPRSSRKLSFARIDFFERMMIITPYEGVNIDTPEIEAIVACASDVFEDKSFSIISNCTAQFSVNPIAYSRFSLLPNLKAVAFVRTTSFGRSNFELEKHFFDKKITVEMFDSLRQATHWILDH